MKKLSVLLALVALVAILGASFSTSAAPNRIVVMGQQEPNNINPILDSMLATADVANLTWGGMLTMNDKWELEPQLALEVPSLKNGLISKDGLTYIWHLRKGVKWSDGQPFTGDDVKYTWEYVMNPNLNVVTRTGFDQIASITVSKDKYTVTMKLKNRYAPFLYTWFGPTIVPKHILSKSKNLNEDPFNMKPVGLGPYVLDKWEHGSYLTFKPNKYYWRKGYPKTAQIVYKVIPDENTAFTQISTKEIDIFQNAPATQYKQLTGLSHVVIHRNATTTYEHLNVNCKSPILSDKRVRQALAYLTDLKTISDTVYEGLWPLAVSDQASPFWRNKNIKPYPFDVAKAGSLLDAAGWKMGNDGYRYKDGKKLTLTVSTTAGRKPREMVEQILQQDYKKGGVDLVIRNYDAGKFFASYDEGGVIDTGDYDLALFAWTSNPDPDDENIFGSKYIVPEGQNNTFYSNKRVDELTAKGKEEIDVAKRKAIYDEVQVILHDEVPMIFTFYWVQIDVANKSIKNFKPQGTNAGNLWNAYEWVNGK